MYAAELPPCEEVATCMLTGLQQSNAGNNVSCEEATLFSCQQFIICMVKSVAGASLHSLDAEAHFSVIAAVKRYMQQIV